MTKVEATRYLANSGAKKLCIRYLHDERGTILFRDVETKAEVSSAKKAMGPKMMATAAMLAIPISLTACMGAMQRPTPLAPDHDDSSDANTDVDGGTTGDGAPDGSTPLQKVK